MSNFWGAVQPEIRVSDDLFYSLAASHGQGIHPTALFVQTEIHRNDLSHLFLSKIQRYSGLK